MNKKYALFVLPLLVISLGVTYNEAELFYNDAFDTWIQEAGAVSVGTDFTFENYRILDESRPRVAVTTVAVGEGFSAAFDATNIVTEVKTFSTEVTITGPESRLITNEVSLKEAGTRTVTLFSILEKGGNYTVTIKIFDNLRDRNEIAPSVDLPLTVTGGDIFTNRELRLQIIAVEAQNVIDNARLTSLETRVTQLERAAGVSASETTSLDDRVTNLEAVQQGEPADTSFQCFSDSIIVVPSSASGVLEFEHGHVATSSSTNPIMLDCEMLR